MEKIIQKYPDCDETIISIMLTNNLKELRGIIQKYGVNMQDEENDRSLRSLLHYAVIADNIEAVNMLLKYKDIDIDISDRYNRTPIFYAVDIKSKPIVKLLLDAGAALRLMDFNNETPVHLAVYSNRVDILKMLLERGGLITAEDYNSNFVVHEFMDYIEYTPLHKAVEENDLEMVELLLKYDSDPTYTDREGDNALHLAARIGNDSIELIKLILLVGGVGIIDEQTVYSLETALHILATDEEYIYNIEPIKLLLQWGANPDIPDAEGDTARSIIIQNEILTPGEINEIIRNREIRVRPVPKLRRHTRQRSRRRRAQ